MAFKNPGALADQIIAPNQRRVKGTSPEYTEKANKDYENALPLLREKGYDVDNFNMDAIEKYLDEFFEGSKADEELQGLYKKGMYDAGNKLWDTKYKPTFNALMAALDKYYNDDWLAKAPMGYEDDEPSNPYLGKTIYELDKVGWSGEHNQILNKLRNSAYDSYEEVMNDAKKLGIKDNEIMQYIDAYARKVFGE